MDLFAGIAVRDYAAAQQWYAKLFGGPPAFHPNDVEAVWQVGEHQFAYVQHWPERAGQAFLTLFVEDLEARLAGIAERGLEPAERETYQNGVTKVTFRDPDGNEIGFGGQRSGQGSGR